MIDEILKQINQAVKELNEEGIKCSFNNIVIIKDNTEG
jgi:hypothetical protein